MKTVVINESEVLIDGVKYAKVESKKKHSGTDDFTITINDNYCTFEYPLNIGRNNSIDFIAKRIYQAFGLPEERGTIKRSIIGRKPLPKTKGETVAFLSAYQHSDMTIEDFVNQYE